MVCLEPKPSAGFKYRALICLMCVRVSTRDLGPLVTPPYLGVQIKTAGRPLVFPLSHGALGIRLTTTFDTNFRSSEMKSQITSFGGPTTEVTNQFGDSSDSTFDYGSLTGTYDLKDWFSRPIPITTFNWVEGANLDELTYPWDDYFRSPKIAEKLYGYSRLRCKLNIKLVINATPFAYSTGIMSYRPLGITSTSNYPFSGGAEDGTDYEMRMVAYSQRPKTWFDAQDQLGSVMELPFISQKNWIDISGPLATATRAELERMGELRLNSFAPLRFSNGVAAQSVEVTLYAWASDLHLSGPSVALQSGVADEYSTTPASDVATAVASATAALSSVPVISPYMRATSAVASMGGTIAKALGYSKPANIDTVSSCKSTTNPSLANAYIPLPSEPLAIDPKNELCVDPRTIGLKPGDDMALPSIVSRDSYWFQFDWQVGAVTGTELARFNVTPECHRYASRTGVAAGAYRAIQMTPLCHMSQVFTKWQGDLIYTFRFVASRYHRGRARIFWDPSGGSAFTADSAFNINQVIDIGSDTVVEVRIPYMRPNAWADVQHRPTLTIDDYSANGVPALSTIPSRASNGTIIVQVLNELSAPDPTANVAVLVEVRAADDFNFALPRREHWDTKNYYFGFSDPYEVQSGVESDSPSVEHTGHEGEAVDTELRDPYIYMGEKFTNLRQLLARTCLSFTANPDTVTVTATQDSIIMPRFPPLPGHSAAGLARTTFVNEAYNFSNNTYLNWFSVCYVGWRGSVIWRLAGGRSTSDAVPITLDISRNPYRTFYVDLTGNSANKFVRNAYSLGNVYDAMEGFFGVPDGIGPDFLSGAGNSMTFNEPTCIVRAPMYSGYRMHPCSPLTMDEPELLSSDTYTNHETDYSQDNLVFTVGTGVPGARVPPIYRLYCSGGDDMTFFFYLNVPVAYFSAIMPTAGAVAGSAPTVSFY